MSTSTKWIFLYWLVAAPEFYTLMTSRDHDIQTWFLDYPYNIRKEVGATKMAWWEGFCLSYQFVNEHMDMIFFHFVRNKIPFFILDSYPFFQILVEISSFLKKWRGYAAASLSNCSVVGGLMKHQSNSASALSFHLIDLNRTLLQEWPGH